MPYILKTQRKQYERVIKELSELLEKNAYNPGHINYIVSAVINKAFSVNPCYSRANELMGALNGITLEFYRRKVGPMEDKKIKENGDIS